MNPDSLFDRLQWKDAYSTGIAELDFDHKNILSLAAQILKDFQQTSLNAIHFHHSYQIFFEKLKRHFHEEEKLLKKYIGNIINPKDHEADHRDFLTKFQQISVELGQEILNPSKLVFSHFADRLLKHLEYEVIIFRAALAAFEQDPSTHSAPN